MPALSGCDRRRSSRASHKRSDRAIAVSARSKTARATASCASESPTRSNCVNASLRDAAGLAFEDFAAINVPQSVQGCALMPSRPSKSRLLRVLGPGLITGASDDDPSGIATYSQAGAQLGYAITWTMLFSYPLMVVIQEISARIGRTTGKGIAGNIRQHYPNWLLQTIVVLLFVANILNIGADLGAMGDASALLIGGSRLLYVVAFG